ncbi:MAG TPA: PKD domain-containing protein [Myxococcota bacterium]|nr:PKD domain-containing protein [Myxococcota bacterium]HRY93760.1 PKD domain-containing protein [Myxococcota bacterium]HSA21017.1 PKD domain-containing protein [Myxococcota bacterium]
MVHLRCSTRVGGLLVAALALALAGCTKDAAGGNRAPRAVAGADLVAALDETVLLDGRASSDPDGDALTFAWSAVAAPGGGTFDLAAPAAAQTSFSPHTLGTYLVRLLVEDGRGGSGQDIVQIRVGGGCGADGECDDGVDCTADSCVQGACQHAPQGSSCPDDGLYCTGLESCDPAAGCVASGDPCAARGLTCDEAADGCTGCAQDADCDDQVACTVDACVAETCSNTPDPGQCPDDGLHCNGLESCDALQGCLHSGDPCAQADFLCDEAGDRCVACLGVADCDDLVACTGDACTDGVCGHTPDPALCPDDGLFCTGVESCDALLGCVASGDPCLAAAQVCDDGLDACVSCQADLDCDDQDPCTADTCQGDGTCLREPMVCDDGVGCTADACVGGACVFTPDDLLCADDGQFCDGAEYCNPALDCTSAGDPCEALGEECRLFCDEALGQCADPAGTPCGDGNENAPCDLADQCDGAGACDPRRPGAEVACPDSNLADCWKAGCDGAGGCDQQAGPEEVGTECRAAGDGCDPPESCAGVGGPCPPDQHAQDGTPCDSGQGDVCGATCQTGTCDGAPPPDGTPCGVAGMCCSEACEEGAVCCLDAECDDVNTCTDDTCTAGQCEQACGDPNCFSLAAPGTGATGAPVGMTLNLCDAGLPPASFTCFSSRNDELVIDEHFEVNYGVFQTNGGDLERTAAAQNPGSQGSMGVAVCGNLAWVGGDIGTSGRHDLLLRFSMANDDTDDHELTTATYRACPAATPECEWRTLALVGDNLSQPYQDFRLLLPPGADDQPQARLSFILTNANNGSDCTYLDDVQLVDLPDHSVARTLLSEDFEAGPGAFTLSGADTNIVADNGGQVLQVVDNRGHTATAQVDTRGADPQNLLVVRWLWRQADDVLAADKYVFLQVSTDGGGSWAQLAGTGHGFRPTLYTEYRAVLPCEAYGLADLRLRFIAPTTSTADSNDGVRVDDFRVEEWDMAWTDEFGPVVDQGGGRYGLTVTSGLSGAAMLWCRQGCGGGALWSNPVDVTFSDAGRAAQP